MKKIIFAVSVLLSFSVLAKAEDTQKTENFLKNTDVHAGTYTGFSYAYPMGTGSRIQRFRQDVFLGVNPKDFMVTNYSFVQGDSSGGGSRGFYGESNLWFGHKILPVDFAFQEVFNSSAPDAGWFGVRLRMSEMPYLKEKFNKIGLYFTIQPHFVGFDWSQPQRDKRMYIEWFYVLDPFKWRIRPRITGFFDQYIRYSNGNNLLNTEQRLELCYKMTDNLNLVPAAEWRRYGFVVGNNWDKSSMAFIFAMTTNF